MLKRFQNFTTLVVTIFLVFGCATGRDPEFTPAPSYVTPEEFGAGIAQPTFRLVHLAGAFYKEKQKTPTLTSLSSFSKVRREEVDWQRFPVIEISENAVNIMVRLDVRSPASTYESKEITTSWEFHFGKDELPDGSVSYSIIPLSYLCIRQERDTTDEFVDFFVALAIAYVFKANTSFSARDLCFKPSSIIPVKIGPRKQQNLEDMKEKLREKLRQKNRNHFRTNKSLFFNNPSRTPAVI